MEDFIILAVGAGAGTAALAATFVLYVALRRRVHRRNATAALPETVFLLRDGKVIDHTPDAKSLFEGLRIEGMDWSALRARLLPAFADLPSTLPDTPAVYHSQLVTDARLQIAATGRSQRLILRSGTCGAGAVIHAAIIAAEHERLLELSQNAPDPLWHTGPDDQLIWCNDAFEALCREAGLHEDDKALFDLPPRTSRISHSHRVSVRSAEGQSRWYEVVSRPLNDGWLHYASSIDSLVNAEMAQRNFVQTLTKTFAHLPIGLAVFDKNRQLVLFNPALIDLTHLPVDFLSSKPNLLSFFDHMRESRMMPEPKNYASWRDKLYDVVSAAREDRYCETWNLSSGLTYKITGRPHPDGAVAFLIEDISAEISLTRRFRSELELSQSVLDCFEDSVAVFSRLGVLTFSNAAYREQWKCDPDSAFAEVTIVDATRDWGQACEPSPIWPEIREFVLTLRDRSAWEARLTTKSGQPLLCSIEPVAAGATLVRFSQDTTVARFHEERSSASG